MQMQTFEELYRRVLEMNRNRTDFTYDPSQMDALFRRVRIGCAGSSAMS